MAAPWLGAGCSCVPGFGEVQTRLRSGRRAGGDGDPATAGARSPALRSRGGEASGLHPVQQRGAQRALGFARSPGQMLCRGLARAPGLSAAGARGRAGSHRNRARQALRPRRPRGCPEPSPGVSLPQSYFWSLEVLTNQPEAALLCVWH